MDQFLWIYFWDLPYMIHIDYLTSLVFFIRRVNKGRSNYNVGVEANSTKRYFRRAFM